MKANGAAALVLIIVGALNVAYGLYRVFAMGQSMLPLVPVGLICTAIGVVLLTRSGKQELPGSDKPGDD